MNNKEEKELLYLQIIGSIIFIVSISISIILTINNINKINNKKPFFNQKEEDIISLINRTIITIIAITFTYISYQFYKMNNFNKNISKKELTSSILNLISTLILLYATIESIKSNSNNTDNACYDRKNFSRVFQFIKDIF